MRGRLEGWFWSLVYVIEWLWNRRQLVFFTHAVCKECNLVYPLSKLDGGLCPSCKAWEEKERLARVQKEAAERELEHFLAEEERRVEKEIDRAWRFREQNS